MHSNCYELIESERFDKTNENHVIMMDKLNIKSLNEYELYRYLYQRHTDHYTDDEIAAKLSDKDCMILAAEHKTCDMFNNLMAVNQLGDKSKP